MKRKVKFVVPEPKTNLDLVEKNIKRMHIVLDGCAFMTTYVAIETVEKLIQETKQELAKGAR